MRIKIIDLIICADIFFDFHFDFSLRFVLLKYIIKEDSIENSKYLYHKMISNEKIYDLRSM